MNKPILFNVSGGGNVIGYNYADNSWATPAAWQEVNIDTHCSFPHMELIEGNYAPHMGATTTHGNAGYLTFFRNYSSSQFAPPAVAGSTDKQTGNITALQFMNGDIDMTVIGNVLGSSTATDLGTRRGQQHLRRRPTRARRRSSRSRARPTSRTRASSGTATTTP